MATDHILFYGRHFCFAKWRTRPGGRYRPYSPGHFRDRRHRSAHAGEDDAPALPTLAHPLIPAAAPLPIANQAELDGLVDHLRSVDRFAYDSEFVGERTYVPVLCLIQVATIESIWLIDTLAGLDLERFWQLLCDPAVQKIVHAGDQDIEPVHRNARCAAANVFDTQIAAGLIGLAYPVALSKLVREVTGVRLEKGHTVTDWGAAAAVFDAAEVRCRRRAVPAGGAPARGRRAGQAGPRRLGRRRVPARCATRRSTGSIPPRPPPASAGLPGFRRATPASFGL